jgi:hypothetical protein
LLVRTDETSWGVSEGAGKRLGRIFSINTGSGDMGVTEVTHLLAGESGEAGFFVEKRAF